MQFKKTNTAKVVGENFSATTSKERKVFSMRFFKHMLTLSVILVVAMSFAATAQANTQVSPVQFSEGPFSTSVTNTSVDTSNGNGKMLVLQDVHVPTNKRSSRCHNVKSGYNSGENANGTLYWFEDHNMRVCPSKASPTGWAKVAGGMTGRNCGNPVKLSRPPRNVVPRSRVKLVAHLIVTATVHVTATANASGAATATCTEASVSASSSINATGIATATAEASATASSVAKAKSTATTNAIKLVTKKKIDVYAAARAEASVSISGKATAFCQGVPAPRQLCPPGTMGTFPHCETPEEPKKPEPPVVTLERIQEIETGEENRTICAHVNPPAGDSVTVQFEAEYGSFTDGGKGSPQIGTDRYCNGTYRPPSEEPPHVCVEPIASELPPGTKCDIVSVLVLSSNGSPPVRKKTEVPIIEETPF